AILAGCGGQRAPDNYGRVTTFSSGPVNTACMTSDRKARNSQLCGCIQTVANRELSRQDQRIAVTFFKDPHRAQEIRQSDRPNHENFWKRYKAFSAQAEQSCRGY
ncbi:MAG: arginine transporter, partial [Rhodobacterales bacterium]